MNIRMIIRLNNSDRIIDEVWVGGWISMGFECLIRDDNWVGIEIIECRVLCGCRE